MSAYAWIGLEQGRWKCRIGDRTGGSWLTALETSVMITRMETTETLATTRQVAFAADLIAERLDYDAAAAERMRLWAVPYPREDWEDDIASLLRRANQYLGRDQQFGSLAEIRDALPSLTKSAASRLISCLKAR